MRGGQSLLIDGIGDDFGDDIGDGAGNGMGMVFDTFLGASLTLHTTLGVHQFCSSTRLNLVLTYCSLTC